MILAGGCGQVSSSSNGSAAPSSGDGDGGAGGGFGDDAGIACHPSHVRYVPPPGYQGAAPPSGACLDADGGGSWDDFYTACLDPGTQSTENCITFKATPANAACAACILTPFSPTGSGQLGPILDYGHYVGGNVAGCIERTSGDLTCARAVQALADCEFAACQTNCPVSDSASLELRDQCAREADQGGCSNFYQAVADCGGLSPDSGPAAGCLQIQFHDFYEAIVPVFCGRTPVDASAPADAAAGTDSGSVPSGDAAALSHDAAAGDAAIADAGAAD